MLSLFLLTSVVLGATDLAIRLPTEVQDVLDPTDEVQALHPFTKDEWEKATPERRRILWKALLPDVLCNDGVVLVDTLKSIVNQMKNLSRGQMRTCGVTKSLILPKLRACHFGAIGNQPVTLYAGITWDVAIIWKYSGATGAYRDSYGNEGCFHTHCGGVGWNFGGGAGFFAGVLLGDGTGDFPGIGHGLEVGADHGMGADLTGGFTTSGRAYGEVSSGVGLSWALGYMGCKTWTNNNIHNNPATGLQHAGEDCWDNCGKKDGPCNWCGTGKCCRKGSGLGGCDASDGGDDFHACVDSGCKRAATWCSAGHGGQYKYQDCDGDGIPDHTCRIGSSFGVIQSDNHCHDTWPHGACPALDWTIKKDHQCKGTLIDIGYHASPDACMATAKGRADCAPIIMFSPNYKDSWGCRCCAPDTHEYSPHSLWDTYIDDKAFCARPYNWCTPDASVPNPQYKRYDCDGDGKLDHTCWDPKHNWFGVIRSGDHCENVWPNAHCRAEWCERPAGWCTPPAVYALKDCDGDGVLEHTCTQGDWYGVIQTRRNCWDTWPNGDKSCQAVSCSDSSDQCPGWASSGECEYNPLYMKQHCQYSCGTCGPKSGCPVGYAIDRFGNAECRDGTKCCVNDKTNSACGEACAKEHCAAASGNWIPLDYSVHPYVCEVLPPVREIKVTGYGCEGDSLATLISWDSTPESCMATALARGLDPVIMSSPTQNWGCRTCAVGAKHSPNQNWDTYHRGYMIKTTGRECTASYTFHGHQTWESCMTDALHHCDKNLIMFSPTYPVWGCKCCSSAAGAPNPNWDTYAFTYELGKVPK